MPAKPNINVSMTLTLDKDAIHSILDAWVRENYPGMSLMVSSHTLEKHYDQFDRSDGTWTYKEAVLKLKTIS